MSFKALIMSFGGCGAAPVAQMEKHLSYRVAPPVFGVILAIAYLASGSVGHPSAAHPLGYADTLIGSPSAGGVAPLATPAAQVDAVALCDQGGYVQFTPDGRRPFTDAAECISYAAQHGGTQGLIRRVSVSLANDGTGTSTFATFSVTGLVPYRQYLAALRIQGRASDSAPLQFTADDMGSYTGQVTTNTPAACIGGIKLFVDVTTLTGYFLGTNGTFLPC